VTGAARAETQENMNPGDFPADSLLDDLAEALAGRGFIVLDKVLQPGFVQTLQEACLVALQQQSKHAGIGRDNRHQVAPAVRSDEICWLDPESAADSQYLGCMEALRTGLNARLFLGLFDYECHYARYAPGAAYQTHVDAFAGEKNRVLSTVFYLNDTWTQSDGGELLLYAPDGRLLERVLPVCNRLVLFMSEAFPHEVLPAARDRLSVAGWFRVKGEKSWLRPV